MRLAQAHHLTAPSHTIFLHSLLVACLRLDDGSSDCHDVRHAMAAPAGAAGAAGKTPACDAATATRLKRLAVLADGAPAPAAAIVPEGSDPQEAREALAALLALKYLLSTLVYIAVNPATLRFFIGCVESALERGRAVDACLRELHESLVWRATAPVTDLNGMLHPDNRVREAMNLVVFAVVPRVFEAVPPAELLGAAQGPERAHLVRPAPVSSQRRDFITSKPL